MKITMRDCVLTILAMVCARLMSHLPSSLVELLVYVIGVIAGYNIAKESLYVFTCIKLHCRKEMTRPGAQYPLPAPCISRNNTQECEPSLSQVLFIIETSSSDKNNNNNRLSWILCITLSLRSQLSCVL